jgi:hypothetical protein
MTINPINPKPVSHLEGNLPSNFYEIQDFIFHREIFSDTGHQVWIPRTSIDEADEQTKQSECFKQIKAAFDQYSEFDCILLNSL